MRRFTHTFPQRISAFLLCLALLVGLLPTSALAAGTDTGKAIQIGASGISGYDSTNGYDYIYYGEWDNSPIKWRVLDEQTNTQNKGLFLLSDVLLGGTYRGVYFDNSGSDSNVWQNSTAQEWCETFYSGNLTTQEQGAVLETTKSDTEFTSSTYGVPFAASENILNGDKVFFLSAEEAENSEYGFTDENSRIANYGNNARHWWLRSPSASYTFSAGLVNPSGHVDQLIVNLGLAARPAFNLDLNSVLFTSAATTANGGKADDTVDSSLTTVADFAGNEWKLTLLDGGRNFTASTSSATTQTQGYSNWTVEVTYSGAQTGSNEYVSAMLVDGSGSVLYYGRVANNSANGTASITIPDGLAAGNYTLKVFCEQYNGDKMTDYASAFEDIDLHVHGWSDTWNSDYTYHWHDCTAARCPITDNSGKDGYGTHTFGGWTTNNNGTHTQACTCGEQKTSNCTYDGEGKCTVCGYEKPTYAISASPEVLDFGSEAEGYADAPAAQIVTITNIGNQSVTVNLPTSTKYTITAGTGFENGAASIAANGTAAFTVQPKTGLSVGSHNATLSISGSSGASAQVSLSFTVNAVYTLTVELNGGSGSTTGGEYAEGAVIHIDAGSRSNYRFNGWTSSNGGTFTDASSASTTFTMPAENVTITANWQYDPPYIPPTKPDGPSTGTSDGWEGIVDELADAEDGDTIAIDMNGETEVPGDIWEAIAGKDVTVILDMGGDVSWTVDGNDVPTATHFADMDFGVDRNTTGIDVDVINAITGQVSSVQITLAHDGEFGFTLTLTAPLGRENAGNWANLYHYDENAKTLNYETSAQVASDGTASLRMTHASQYAIIIDDQTHQLPFEDVPAGAWYEGAVRYAYLHDIMEGMSATTFQPNGTLSRAMAVQIFYNLEGHPDLSGENLGYPYEDVNAEEWYGDAVYWARLTGVATGYGDGTFQPGDSITRQEFAQMLYNYAKYKGCDLAAEGDLSQFPDSGSVADWAEAAMSWANGNKLINGHDDGTLEPGGTTTRAQAASILMRFDQNLVEK